MVHSGGLAQLGEHLAGSQKVRGSSPLSSTELENINMFNWIKNLISSSQPEAFGSTEGLKTERYYQLKCNAILQGKTEYRLTDNTRVDILTDDLAIEVDFAKKWYEAIGQAAHYSRHTNKKPAILLIVRNVLDEKYVKAAIEACRVTQVNGYYIAVLVYRDKQ